MAVASPAAQPASGGSTPLAETRTPFDRVRPFVRGGLAGCMGWLFVHPADLLKTRAQVIAGGNNGSLFQVARTIVANEGPAALYSGLSAALTRQVVYTTLRLGLYQTMRDSVSKPGETVPGWKNLSVGLAAGGIASAISTPVEVSMVRMYADGALPEAQKRGYKHIGDALSRIAREEGVKTLWRGASPTVARAMVVNCVQLGVYDSAKDTYTANTGLRGVPLHLAASITSGFCYSVASLPIDLAKSKMQNQPSQPNLKYTSIPQTLVVTAKADGIVALWSGFVPYFARCGGHTVAMFLCLEQVKKFI